MFRIRCIIYKIQLRGCWTTNLHNKSLSDVTNSIFEGLTDELGDSVKNAIPYNKLEFKLIQDTKTDYYKGIKILLDDV